MSLGDGPAQIQLEERQREEQDVQQQRQVEPPQALHAEARHRNGKAHLRRSEREGLAPAG